MTVLAYGAGKPVGVLIRGSQELSRWLSMEPTGFSDSQIAAAPHYAETYRKISTWAVLPGSHPWVWSYHEPDCMLQQMSYSAMGREEGEGCLRWNLALCLSACIFVLFSFPFPFWDPLAWGVWKLNLSPFTRAENTVWPHKFYLGFEGCITYEDCLIQHISQPNWPSMLLGGLSYFAQPGS